MTSNSENTEAIILETIPFKEEDLIVHAFTKELGLASFFFKRSRKNQGSLFSPFTVGEITYQPKEKELLKGLEFSPKNFNFPLRESLNNLETAFSLKNSLKEFILPYKKAPFLYSLFNSFLKKIPEFKEKELLEITLQIKLLKHEGLLNYPLHCSLCGKELTNFSFNLEGFFCEQEKVKGVFWGENEIETLWTLFVTQKFEEIKETAISPLWKEQWEALYTILKGF